MGYLKNELAGFVPAPQAADETGLLTDRLKTAYKEGYYGMLDDTAKGLDVGLNFSLLNDRAIEEAVGAKWHGKRFSERVWTNTDRLARTAQAVVVKSLMTGASEVKTARELAEEFEVEKYRATTLVRTETAHIHAVADKKAYEDLGIPEYKYLATLDYRTCHICGALDGMVFKVSEIREGENYPSMHPRCRCTTTMNMSYTGRSARNVFTGKSETIDGSVTYKEWRDGMSDEEKAAFELAQKKDSRRTADKAQYAKYKSVLGAENVPKTLDEFQNVMYNGGEEWTELKQAYRYINANPSAEYKHYLIYAELKSRGINQGVVLPNDNVAAYILKDETSKREPYHIMHRMAERNITDDEVREYKNTAKVMFSQWNGSRRAYYTEDGVSVITKNPEQWVFKTVWRKEDFDENTEQILEVIKKYE